MKALLALLCMFTVASGAVAFDPNKLRPEAVAEI